MKTFINEEESKIVQQLKEEESKIQLKEAKNSFLSLILAETPLLPPLCEIIYFYSLPSHPQWNKTSPSALERLMSISPDRLTARFLSGTEEWISISSTEAIDIHEGQEYYYEGTLTEILSCNFGYGIYADCLTEENRQKETTSGPFVTHLTYHCCCSGLETYYNFPTPIRLGIRIRRKKQGKFELIFYLNGTKTHAYSHQLRAPSNVLIPICYAYNTQATFVINSSVVSVDH